MTFLSIFAFIKENILINDSGYYFIDINYFSISSILLVSTTRLSSFWVVPKRGMLSRLGSFLAKKGTKMIPSNVSSGTIKDYATTNVRHPDPNSIDPQAAVNNPLVNKGGHTFQHPEIVRGTCEKPGCNAQDCGPLPSSTSTTGSCGETVIKLESVAHSTSGNPSVAKTGKVVPIDANTNMVGAAKQQNAVVYNTPHATGVTSEAFLTTGKSTGKGTDFIHDPNNPHRIATILNETKNK